MNCSTVKQDTMSLPHMIHRIRLRTASEMEAERLRDHHACMMAPKETIIMGKGSTTPLAIPSLLGARKIISPTPPSHPTPMTEPAWRPINIRIQLASIQVPEASRSAKPTLPCLRHSSRNQEIHTNRIRMKTVRQRTQPFALHSDYR